MRHPLPREFYIPKGATKIADKKSDAVAYIYQADSVTNVGTTLLYGMVFWGKQSKPVMHFRFKTAADREKRIAEYFKARQARAARKAEDKASRKPAKLEPGHILDTCWGYDQTNREFYQVTKLIGSTMVEVREIGQVRDVTGWEQGTATPKLDEFIGPPKRVKIGSYGVKVDGHHASIWEGRPVRWTSYA